MYLYKYTVSAIIVMSSTMFKDLTDNNDISHVSLDKRGWHFVYSPLSYLIKTSIDKPHALSCNQWVLMSEQTEKSEGE